MHITSGKRHVRFPTILSIPQMGKQVIPSLTALRPNPFPDIPPPWRR
jgi:hypothetical protein